jgi:hypothetical protein
MSELYRAGDMENDNPKKDLRLPFFGSFLGIQKRTGL